MSIAKAREILEHRRDRTHRCQVNNDGVLIPDLNDVRLVGKRR